jgi:hypothetical protein
MERHMDTPRVQPPAAFFEWIDSEIARLEAGGQPPGCFAGSREECLASMRAERAELAKLPPRQP